MPDKTAVLGLRERKKARTRASIREHAMRLFLQQGFAQTSVEQIAEAAEVSPSTFFRYFPTKEDVVLADDLDPILFAALAALPPELPPLVALRRAVEVTYREMAASEVEREDERQQLLFAVPELRAAIMRQLYSSIDMIAGAIAQRLGRSPDDFEIKVFAGAVTGAVMGGASGPDGGIGNAVKAIELLEQGLPLT
jgi:AcrR family transcriptional regulator